MGTEGVVGSAVYNMVSYLLPGLGGDGCYCFVFFVLVVLDDGRLLFWCMRDLLRRLLTARCCID